MKTMGFVGIAACLVAASLLGCSAEAGETAGSQSEAVDAPGDPTAAPAAGSFACGTLTCDASKQFCQHVVGGAYRPGYAGTYTCVDAPASCSTSAALTCACVRPHPGPARCSESNGDVTVTILAP
jgi:hypothetical protein